ncbi:MAG: redox-regulated ATPase YchF [Hydrotalea sp.]|nr:redox-regulated ATPase YchF [Hydrotalea sp.]
MSFHCGIVGLPNVGKSTLFNALTQTQSAEAANYPFCTIEPNIGRVAVPDKRLTNLAKIYPSDKIIPAQMEFVDIAGLVKGASKGEGLGNQFLGHIRAVDAIAHVVRCFEDGDIVHVSGAINPLSDVETIRTELLLSDLEALQKRKDNMEKKVRAQDKDAVAQMPLLLALLKLAEAGDDLAGGFRAMKPSAEDMAAVQGWQLLSLKPMMLICNVAEGEVATGNAMSKQVEDFGKKNNIPVVIISAKIESEIAMLAEDERAEFLQTLGLHETGLSHIIRIGYQLLDRISFFTVGPKEARSWSVKKNSTAQEAAGTIHTDFARGFIAAETINYQDLLDIGSEAKAKELGKIRLEGKSYIVQDGDVFHFRFAV